MVFLNPGKPSGQHLSGSLHLPLNIPSLLIEATHTLMDSGWYSRGFFLSLQQISVYLDCLPDGVESLCVIPGTCSLYIRMLLCVQGRWEQSPTVGPANETAVVGHVSSSLWRRYSK